MSIVDGPFPQQTFLGASVTSVSVSLGWNEQSSTLTVGLVEDEENGDIFTNPSPGTPVRFSYEKLVFEGLVQRTLRRQDISGKPVYEVTVTDPREVLAGAQVIIDAFRGDVSAVPNLLNAFGYYEDKLGFGGALVNESGMVWNAPGSDLNLDDASSGGSIKITLPSTPVGIMPAIQELTLKAGPYGGPLLFMGNYYNVDLSALPLPPAYYRLGGVSISIMDAVSQICQDGGCDYICYLDGNTIRFKTVSRVKQPNIGGIEAFVNKQQEFVSSSNGLELRNDFTSFILLGGNIINLIPQINAAMDNTIAPFWGFDGDGKVIMGDGQPEDSTYKVNLNAAPIVDIIGQTTYPTDIRELRCAMIDFDSWAAYVILNSPDKAQTINLSSAIDSTSPLADLFPDVLFQRDMIAEAEEDVTRFGQMNESDYWTKRAQRVYEFVQQYANEYFGKKFLVRIPFLIYWKYEPETTHIISSDEPADAGFTSDGSMPLGLQFLNESAFIAQDGRFECFVKFTDIDPTKIDLQNMDSSSAVLQDTDLYVKAQIDQGVGIVYPPNEIFPYVVVNVNSPVYELATDPLGGIADIATILNVPPVALAYAIGLRHDSFPFRIHPAPHRPYGVALPMKSNRDSYGPWHLVGQPGKVNFQRDESLVPWNYGDYDTMNKAAQAKLADSATQMQVAETGSLELPGSPQFSIGDTLVQGGPNITNMRVSISTSGVTTAYEMQTFTPKYAAFTKGNADRLRRLGLAAQDMRRAVRTLFENRAASQNIMFNAQMGFMANTSRAVSQATPHQVLVGSMSFSQKYGYRTQVSTQTAPEAMANIRGDSKTYYPATAVMTMEGLLRPFSTNFNNSDLQMPHYEGMTGSFVDGAPNRKSLDPVGDKHDIDYIAWGDTYKGLHVKKTLAKKDKNGVALAPDYANTRMLGLRGPMVMVGWGFEMTGKPVPNKDTGNSVQVTNWSTDFADDFRTHPEKWKAGPVALFWDNWRKVWTIPTLLFGTLDADLAVSGTVKMTIDGTGGDKVTVYPYFSTSSTPTMLAGTKVCAGYDQLSNRWNVIAAGCSI